MGKHAIIENKIKGLGEEYVIVSKPDMEALSKLVDMARGKRSIEVFAQACHISAQLMYGIAKKRRVTNVNYHHICAIADHADKESVITLQMLMDANGMIPASKVRKRIEDVKSGVDRIRDLPEPENRTDPRDKPCYRLRPESEDALLGVPEPYGDPYKDFVVDLAFYAGRKDDEQIKDLHDGKEKYYADAAIKKMLRNFRCKSVADEQRRIDGLRKYFRTGLREDFPEANADEYEHVLDEVLLGKDRI